MAPYHVVVVPINYDDATMKSVADSVYENLKKTGVEVILDDRNAKPGFKFKDWDLIGIPYMIVVGKRAGEGIVEVKCRMTGDKTEETVDNAVNNVVANIKDAL